MAASGYTGNPPGSGGGGGTGAVDSVNGRTGAVVLSRSDVQLSLVDNTADINKPVSTAVSTALSAKADTSTVTASLALKAPLASPTFTGAVSGVSAAMVGLGSVNNTADSAKPVSTAQAAAIALKSDLASPTFTGTPAVPTAAPGTNTTQAASTAYVTAAVAAGGGGGGTAATFARAYVTTGDITPGVTGSFTAVAGLTLAIPAVVGDDLTLNLSCLLNQTSADFYEMVVLVGGTIVRYSSTGTGSPSATAEGDPSIYPLSGAPLRSANAQFAFTATSGDISSGNVTFALAFKGSGAGKVFASANYPFRWSARNDH